MAERAIGQVHGKTIDLEVKLPALEGQRVSLIIESLDGSDETLDVAQYRELWRVWCEHGPQGPIDDDGEPEFP